MALSPQERGKLGAQKRWAADQEREGEVPKYRITAICYGEDDKIYDPEATQKDEDGNPKPLYMETWNEYPAYYMEPANEAARAMCAKHPSAQVGNALDELTRLSTDAPRAA